MNAEEVVSQIKLEEYIGQYVSLTQDGGDWWGLCPFHSEATPSFSITPERGLWWCFGCHTGGDLLTFVKKYHRVGYSGAMKLLCEHSGFSGEFIDQRLRATKIMRRFNSKARCSKIATYKALDPAVMSTYEDDESKLKSWKDEGISGDTLRRFQVKYDPFSNRLVFPIRSPDGHIISVSGRTLDPDWKEKKLRKYTYFQSIGKLDVIYGIWENLNAIRAAKEIVLFEGAKSVMLCDTWGITNTGALLTSHLNPDQRKILMKLGVRIVLALDADVDVSKDEEIRKLLRFVRVETVTNEDGLLLDKMSPVDAGLATWKTLYERRKRLN